MSSTVTAMFDTRAEAEAARDRLNTAGYTDANFHDKTSAGFNEQNYSSAHHESRGIWDSVKHAFLPDEDRHTYEEGVRRGGTVLSVDVDDHKVDDVVRILEEDTSSIDIDERSQQWRQSGWDYAGAGATGAATGASTGLFGGTGTTDTDRDYADRDTTTGLGTDLGTSRGTDRGDREEVIPIVEEQLVVGKREVSRGGARVRSYVTETPVHEQVRLRNERVDVERRAVDLPLSAAGEDAFRERTIDVTATGEEAVVGKNARVVEEVVVTKSAEETTQNVSDTVRRTEVEIDRDNDGTTTGGATGSTSGTSFGSGSDYDADRRS